MAATVLYTPDELLQQATLGRKLKPKERLAVMVHLEKTGDVNQYPDSQLAKLLGCKLSTLAQYRNKARATVASAISPDEAMNYMAEFVRLQDLLIQEAREGLRSAPKNSGVHQGYMRLLKEVSAEKIEKLQSIGVIPKELGRLTTISEEWVATISAEDVASCNRALPGESDES